MPRKARRDCRKSETKKNHMNIRVEKLQKEIRKSKKEATAAAAQATAAPSSLTPAAASFLSQMRSDIAKELPTLKDAAKPAGPSGGGK